MSRFRTPTRWFLPEVVQMAQWLAATHGYSGVAMWRSILSWKRTRSLPEIYPLKMAIPMGSDIWLLSYHVLWVSKQHGDVMDNWCLTTVIILLCLYWDYYQQGIPSNKPIRWQRCSSRKTLTMRVRFHKKSDGRLGWWKSCHLWTLGANVRLSAMLMQEWYHMIALCIWCPVNGRNLFAGQRWALGLVMFSPYSSRCHPKKGPEMMLESQRASGNVAWNILHMWFDDFPWHHLVRECPQRYVTEGHQKFTQVKLRFLQEQTDLIQSSSSAKPELRKPQKSREDFSIWDSSCLQSDRFETSDFHRENPYLHRKTIITIPSQCVIAGNFRWQWYRWPIYLHESYNPPNIKHPHRPVPSFCGSITSTMVTGVEYVWGFYRPMKIPMISPLISHLMGVYLINSPLSPMKSPRKSPVRWWQLLTVEARTFFKQIVRAVPGVEKSWVFFVSEQWF